MLWLLCAAAGDAFFIFPWAVGSNGETFEEVGRSTCTVRLGRCECSWKHAIGKQPSVKVINFMLKDACRPTFEGPGFLPAIRLKSFNLNRPVAANIRLKTGNAETPLCLDHHLRGSRVPNRIDDCLKRERISIPSLLLFGRKMAHPILSVLNDEKA